MSSLQISVPTIDLYFFDHQVSPHKNRGLPHLGRAFTDVQEMRQAAWPDAMSRQNSGFQNPTQVLQSVKTFWGDSGAK